ncbi:uncharacterized protein [Nicotiana sylvestris]|uniref:uncharacterized protein n=1 Tax=Nicotiana sylvestris TaxID=4096 RepID=UPI00388C5804
MAKKYHAELVEQSQLGSVVSAWENLVAKLEAAKSEVKAAKADADAVVAIYQADVEAAQIRAKEVAEATQIRAKEVFEAAQVQAEGVVEHAKCQSRRETLEEIHARGFDLTTEIENAKELEVEARKLAYPDDDDDESGSLSEFGSREDTDGGDVSPEDDQAT